jgi:hypothetical protein
MSNDTALTSSSIEGLIRWSENDMYVTVMGKLKHSGHVREVLRALPRRFSSCLTMPSPESQVTSLLDEINELKGLLVAQQQWLQAHAAQYKPHQQLI